MGLRVLRRSPLHDAGDNDVTIPDAVDDDGDSEGPGIFPPQRKEAPMSSPCPPRIPDPELRSVEREPVTSPYVRLRWKRFGRTDTHEILIWDPRDPDTERHFYYPGELDEALIPIPAGWDIAVRAVHRLGSEYLSSAQVFHRAPPARAETPSDVVAGVARGLRKLGSQVRAARKSRKRAIPEIAGKDRIGISYQTWRNVEHGRSRTPLSAYVLALRALDLIDPAAE